MPERLRLEITNLLHVQDDMRNVFVSLLLQGKQGLRGPYKDLGLPVFDVILESHLLNDGFSPVVCIAFEIGPSVFGDHLVSKKHTQKI